ncbi:hypothetical protein RJ641_036610, partial [Dillenia turbinata]
RNRVLIGPRIPFPCAINFNCRLLQVGSKSILKEFEICFSIQREDTLSTTTEIVDEVNHATLPLEEALKDTMRISYHHQHLKMLHKAI